MKRAVTVTDIHRNFADYVNRVAYRGESFILVRGGKPVAELGPVPSGMRLGDLAGVLDSLPRLAPDDAREFAEDLTRARAGGRAMPLRDPWDS